MEVVTWEETGFTFVGSKRFRGTVELTSKNSVLYKMVYKILTYVDSIKESLLFEKHQFQVEIK